MFVQSLVENRSKLAYQYRLRKNLFFNVPWPKNHKNFSAVYMQKPFCVCNYAHKYFPFQSEREK